MNTRAGIKFEIVKEWNDTDNNKTIKVNGELYTIEYLPRPCFNEADLRAVFYKGIRYANIKKFLQAISI